MEMKKDSRTQNCLLYIFMHAPTTHAFYYDRFPSRMHERISPLKNTSNMYIDSHWVRVERSKSNNGNVQRHGNMSDINISICIIKNTDK